MFNENNNLSPVLSSAKVALKDLGFELVRRIYGIGSHRKITPVDTESGFDLVVSGTIHHDGFTITNAHELYYGQKPEPGPEELPEEPRKKGRKAAEAAEDFRVLGYGVDTLEINYFGALRQSAREAFIAAKEKASEVSKAKGEFHVELGKRMFKVVPFSGRTNFALRLEHADFQIHISLGTCMERPRVLVVFRSMFLWSFGGGDGWEQATREVHKIIRQFFRGKKIESNQISRVDLCCDTTGLNLEMEDAKRFVTRAVNVAGYRKGSAIEKKTKKRKKEDVIGPHDKEDAFMKRLKFTGLGFGSGKTLSVKLYEKSLEMRGSDKESLMWSVWGAEKNDEGVQCVDGIPIESGVWRIESCLRRDGLRNLGIDTIEELEACQYVLWNYCTDWLSLRIPTKTKKGKLKQRTHWEVDEKWEQVKECFKFEDFNTGNPDIEKLEPKPIKVGSAKQVERLVKQSMGCLASAGKLMGFSSEYELRKWLLGTLSEEEEQLELQERMNRKGHRVPGESEQYSFEFFQRV